MQAMFSICYHYFFGHFWVLFGLPSICLFINVLQKLFQHPYLARNSSLCCRKFVRKMQSFYKEDVGVLY
jgi:hypothetical protein